MIKSLMGIFFLVSACSFAQLTPTRTSFNESDYFIAKKIPLSMAEEGLDGVLELLQDKSFKTWKNPASRQEAIDAGWDQMEDPRQYKTAILRLKSKEGKVIESANLDKIFDTDEAIWIGLGLEDLYGSGRTTYSLLMDYEIGNGTGQGIYTRYFDVVKGHLVWLTSKAKAGSKKTPIELRNNMEDSGMVLPNPNGKGKVFCQRMADPYEEITTYIRYEFDGKEWVRYDRVDKGVQDSEAEFPDVKKFY